MGGVGDGPDHEVVGREGEAGGGGVGEFVPVEGRRGLVGLLFV